MSAAKLGAIKFKKNRAKSLELYAIVPLVCHKILVSGMSHRDCTCCCAICKVIFEKSLIKSTWILLMVSNVKLFQTSFW